MDQNNQDQQNQNPQQDNQDQNQQPSDQNNQPQENHDQQSSQQTDTSSQWNTSSLDQSQTTDQQQPSSDSSMPQPPTTNDTPQADQQNSLSDVADHQDTAPAPVSNSENPYIKAVGNSLVDLLTDISMSDERKQKLADAMGMSKEQVVNLLEGLLNKIDTQSLTEAELALIMTSPITDEAGNTSNAS